MQIDGGLSLADLRQLIASGGTGRSATIMSNAMRSRILGLLAVSLLTGQISAEAATLQVNGAGILTGALGVSVDGTLYDVTFQDGTCAGLFAGCDDNSDFVFSSATAASSASQALLDQVFQSQFDTTP